MSLSLNEDEIKVFRCPNCKQFISNKSDKCRFCSFEITEEIKHRESELQQAEDKGFRINTNKNILYVGLGIFALGLSLLSFSLVTIFSTGQGRFFIWSPIITLVGLGQIIYGLYGIYQEKK